jgi:hypothetical protein
MRELGVTRRRRIGPVEFRPSAHASPMGGPASAMAVLEARLLPDGLVNDIRLLAGDSLDSMLADALREESQRYWAALYRPRRKTIRRLSYFADKEGKTRVIALLDW